MRIIYINTQNIVVAKDMLVRKAIEAGMQYVEMEDDVLIDCEYLFKFVPKEIILDSFPLIFNINEKQDLFKIIDREELLKNSCSSFPSFKKSDFKRESKKVNVLTKNKQYNNLRRRYK